jgi:WD40 repeat protein
VAFSPAGDRIASGSSDGTVALWDGTAGHPPRMLSEPLRGVKALAFSPDGKMLAAAFGVGQVNLWTLDSAQAPQTFAATETDHQDIEGARVVFSPDGRFLALSGTLASAVTVWELGRGQRVARLVGGSHGVHAMEFSHGGKRFAATGGDAVVRLWSTESWAVVAAQTGGFGPLAFSPDDRLLATGGHDRAVLWEVEEPATLTRLTAHAEPAGRIQFSPDGAYLASASPDRDVAVWEASTGREIGRFQPPREPSADLEPVLRGRDLRVSAFSPDGRTLATGGRQGERFGEGGRRGDLVIWEFAGSRRTNALTGHRSGLAAVAFSPDGAKLASSDSSSIRLWNPANGEGSVLQETRGALALAFDPASTKLAAGSGDDVLVWNLQSRGDPVTLRGHERPVNQLRFASNGRVLVSGSFDGTLRFWDASRPEPVLLGVGRHSGDIKDLAVSGDGRIAASGSRDRTVGVWDARTAASIHRLTSHDSEVSSVSLNADGTMLASAGDDGTVILWDLATGTELVRLGLRATRVAFSPRHPLLATAGSDLQVGLWDVDLPAWAERAGSIANRELTAKEWQQFLGTLPYRSVLRDRPHPSQSQIKTDR